MTYAEFLLSKRPVVGSVGIEVDRDDIHPSLFEFQRDLVVWSLRKGRCALFADTGLGKTRMQLEWARLLHERLGLRALFFAPLSVARQTVAEAAVLGIDLIYARSQDQAGPLTITNYEMADRFDPSAFGIRVLDESSVLKATETVTRNERIEQDRIAPYRLCCSATPAPNDIGEITNHSDYLGVMRRRDVLATFFLHEANDARASGWRLKRHAREAFWRWMASWGMSLKRPSDLGYSDEGYVLPPLDIRPLVVGGKVEAEGRLFIDRIRGVTDRAAVRRATVEARVEATLGLIGADAQPWIAWCGLNDESERVARELGSEAIEVTGSQPPEEKAERIEAFVDGAYRVLVTKPRIAGFGMNFQHCSRMAFVGIGDSFEQYYQAIRRCWRYGQTRPVEAHIVVSEPERAVYENVMRKEREAAEMAAELVKHVAAYERAEIGAMPAAVRGYEGTEPMRVPGWVA